MRIVLIYLGALFTVLVARAQGYQPRIEPMPSPVRTAPELITKSGYLVVPENRRRPAGPVVRIPFVFVRKAEADSVKHIALMTTGGPGYSTIANFDSIGAGSELLRYGGFIIFSQRGVKGAIPCLDCPETTTAVRKAYRENLPKDSLELEAIKRCRKRLAAQGIDLSSYTTLESAADINDLRKALHLDSLMLIGMSYSGGLMLSVARHHPEAVSLLLLNSPLPGYVNYEEHALLNMNEAFNQVFDNCEADSTSNPIYTGLREKFHQYFTSITGKTFSFRYSENNSQDTFTIRYGKNELMDALLDRMNGRSLKTVPFVMYQIINGQHAPYVKEVVDAAFAGNQRIALGMRYSVYCSEQIAFASKQLIRKQNELVPWLADFTFNDPDTTKCDCWNVKREPAGEKEPVYSNVPALIFTGDADPWCRPFYNRLIKRYLPNSQLLLIYNQGHVPSLGGHGANFLDMFINNPSKKLVSTTKDVMVE